MSVIAVLPRLLGLTAAGILLFVLIPVDMKHLGTFLVMETVHMKIRLFQ